MLDSFIAQNFRQFINLELPRLSTVNLFVGRNNAGKSALLEAIEVYATGGTYRTLLSIVSAREETWGGSVVSENMSVGNEVFRHLFRGHLLPEPDTKGFIVGPLAEPKKQLQVTTAVYQSIPSQDGGMIRAKVEAAQISELQEDVEMHLVSIEDGQTRRIIGLNRPGRFISRFEADNRTPIQVVPTKNMQPEKVAALWDVVGLNEEREVINGLKLIENGITGIKFVKAEGPLSQRTVREARVPLASIAGHTELFPLRSMGDGLTRLFHVVLALVNAKKGVLLIDEFENGLHWSIQEDVWKTIFTLAASLNVQVFATTHSRDCVQAFSAAWQEQPEHGTYYRLENTSVGETRARAYSLETLTDSVETDTETR